MILTLGYDGKNFTTAHLAKILDDTQAVLVDVRLTAFSRIKGWGTNQLKAAIGADRYIARPDLGGGTAPKAQKAGLEFLKQFDTPQHPNCILFCKEEMPSECHRHLEITGGYDTKTHNFPHAQHIFRDEVYSETALDAFINGGTDLVLTCPTAELSDYVQHCNAD